MNERLDVSWTPDLERELSRIYLGVRLLPPLAPEDMRAEKERLKDFLAKVLWALRRQAPDTIDLEVVGAMDRLKLVAGLGV